MKNGEVSSKREITRSALLSLLPKGSICAEVGVSTGTFSKKIVQIVSPSQLVLIDPWDLLAQELKGTQEEGKWFAYSDGMADKYQSVVNMFKGVDSVKIMKGFSEECLSDFPDDYFDWVYLDARHEYKHVMAELALSFRKVKVGGYITGDDFFKKHNGEPEVRKAVIDTLKSLHVPADIDVLLLHALPQKVEVPSRLGQQFIIPVTADTKKARS